MDVVNLSLSLSSRGGVLLGLNFHGLSTSRPMMKHAVRHLCSHTLENSCGTFARMSLNHESSNQGRIHCANYIDAETLWPRARYEFACCSSSDKCRCIAAAQTWRWLMRSFPKPLLDHEPNLGVNPKIVDSQDEEGHQTPDYLLQKIANSYMPVLKHPN